MVKGTRGTGRKAHGGGKSRTNTNHLRAHRRGVVKGRWDDICTKELLPENIEKTVAEKTVLDPDKPGLGQHYCVACCRYFIDFAAFTSHNATSKHRRRLKMLTTVKPYSHEEARAAAGAGPSDHGMDPPRLPEGGRAMET
eukprot:CAMPEP_0206162994 /NCGR_PEP_ID=MMETSP1474-20131121/11144_1 /ASSEMBLY_ACC=CAM_ASM_001110 /TAXON_ID=97495 /ORGANISM="Imantonia sp., Strain RCC918" /LENGTH=139 /DNA_ID=CAMNT_0053565401 /DNA_START=76 /DNA_END=495 /DNA_ORIENTATION=+